ncbi:MAG: SGNH/GDSL hydrolase family protein [Ferruginibacter sp.]
MKQISTYRLVQFTMLTVFYLFLLLNALHAMGQDQLNDWANLKKYAADNKKLKAPSKGEKRVVFMGDSITESWISMDSGFFIGKSYIDRGISGQTTPQMLIRFPQDVIALKPALVVILAGINDIAENTGPFSLEKTFQNIIAMVELAQKYKIKVVLSSVLPAYDFRWRPGLKPAEKVIKLNALIKTYCKAHNIVYVDYYSKMVDERKGLHKKFTEDGVHPTLAGYKIMEPLVEKAIKKALM